MNSHPGILVNRAVLCLLLASITHETTYADIPSRQFAKVEVSELLAGSGPTVLTSSATEPLDLMLGRNTHLESSLRTSISAPHQGVSGELFVQATSILVPESSATARLEYDFLLSQRAELLNLLFFSQFDGLASFLLERDGSPVFSSSGERLIIEDADLAPGFYEMTVEASASISNAVAIGFNTSQVTFALAFTTVPEPSTAVLASMLLVTLFWQPTRRV
jgi:hypothetical protein